MTRPVKIYRWDDEGAPQRSSSNPVEIVNILKKCLVDGYGTKDPLGWTLEYEDALNAIAVFRNSPVTGSGGYFRIQPYSATTAYILTQSAMAATGINRSDLFNPGYINSIPSDENFSRWILVGDDRSFYFILHHKTADFISAVDEVVMFFGDYNPSVKADVATFICTGRNESSVSSALAVNSSYLNSGPISSSGLRVSTIDSLNSTFTSGGCGLPTDVAGDIMMTTYVFYVPGESAPSINLIVAGYPVGALLQPFALKRNERVSNGNVSDVNLPYLRGYLPGLFSAGWVSFADATWPVVNSMLSKRMLGLSAQYTNQNYRGVAAWLNIEDWE